MGNGPIIPQWGHYPLVLSNHLVTRPAQLSLTAASNSAESAAKQSLTKNKLQ